MMKTKFIQYYVEGEDEKKLIDVLKTDLRVIEPGNVQKLNVVQNEITNMRLLSLRPGTMVVLIFDTDVGNTSILNSNLKKLKACSAVSEIVTIPQVLKLEHELEYSCNIKKITELLGSKSIKNFKSDFIQVSNLAHKLTEHGFDIKKLWCKDPPPPFQDFENQADKIKLFK